MQIYPVIMSGGSGSRLWPLSRESCPKQFLMLAGEHSLFQQAARRAGATDLFHPVTVVANVEHRFLVGEQLQAIGATPKAILLEPIARNTAAAVAFAALHLVADDPQAVLLVMPADHLVRDIAAFTAAVRTAAVAAEAGSLALFGITPASPQTGYGYIRPGAPVPEAAGVRRVERFIEKPDAARAADLVAEGCLWNSGIFLFGARTYLDQLARFEPAVLSSAGAALERSRQDADFVRLDTSALEPCPDISIDNAVMERTPSAAVVEVEMGWTDVGSWSALWDIGEKDAHANVLIGPAISEASSGCYVRSEGPAVATLGVEDLIVIATPDAVLVTHKSTDQLVKTAVTRLRAANHPSATRTAKVDGP